MKKNLQSDSYKETGCYNLLCSGFVQTTNKVALGAAIYPISMYDRRQFDITILIWKVAKPLFLTKLCMSHSYVQHKTINL
ncbi:hypothetical protein AXF42_Ash021587 [Apostasia shenzhenica]|uniref:Neprosin PEP catalytic domain-containing protein n=1 Tax=Apostasia shenzhenica TaxID=1088818 RepID=A0A2H9ZUD8_9ASPA|nr:hypothetical protein AXF42_Ash021587 [Apostasia shenzhenica]